MAIGRAADAVVPSTRASAKTLLLLCGLFSGLAVAMPVKLENATATFPQGPFGGGPYTPDQAVDGSFFPGNPSLGTGNGWSIDHFPGDFTTDETAVWATHTDIGPGPKPTLLTFTLYFLHWNSGHLLGHFRLSVTTDDRSTFADGLAVGGDVTANWTVLTDLNIEGPADDVHGSVG